MWHIVKSFYNFPSGCTFFFFYYIFFFAFSIKLTISSIVSVHAVIYDGCPKTITQGIWWPRTKFNLPAAVPCPKGSVGPCARTYSHTISGDLPPYDLVRVVTLLSSRLCRRRHQTLWRGEGVAGARPLQLHLAAVCGAQHRCMFPVWEAVGRGTLLVAIATCSLWRIDCFYMQTSYGNSRFLFSTYS